MSEILEPDICPKCGSDEIYHENPLTGYGGYVCDDCGFEFSKEKKPEFKELGTQRADPNRCPVCGAELAQFGDKKFCLECEC